LHVLDELDGEFVFNLADGSGIDGHPGVEVPIALERRGVKFSGAGSMYYENTTDKWTMKVRLANARVPVPYGVVVPHPDTPLPTSLIYPLIVKPRDAYGSVGIDERSVTHNPDETREAVARITRDYDTDALVEHFIPGRELTVGIIGEGRRAWALPPLEVEFGPAYRGKPKIKTFATKFDVNSPLYHDFWPVCPARLPPTTMRHIEQVSLRAYRAVGGDSYGRVDIRLARDGTPFVLEVNANCSLEEAPDPHDCSMLPLIGRAMGWTYPQLMARLIGAGLLRRPCMAQPRMALRWCAGRTSLHATQQLPRGATVRPVGPIYRVPGNAAGPKTMRTTEGRAVFVEPHMRHLPHSDAPALEVANHDGVLTLKTTRPVAWGEALTLDRTRALDLPTVRHRPYAHGRRLVAHTRAALPVRLPALGSAAVAAATVPGV
jgi:D-alanine-D-alanine ligase